MVGLSCPPTVILIEHTLKKNKEGSQKSLNTDMYHLLIKRIFEKSITTQELVSVSLGHHKTIFRAIEDLPLIYFPYRTPEKNLHFSFLGC